MKFAALLVAGALGLAAPAAFAQESTPPRWYFQTSLATLHWSPSPDHVNRNYLLNLERHSGTGFILGGAAFKNSFGQSTQFAYVGKIWRPFEQYQFVHVKLTAGIVHGYRNEFRDKIPLNGNGVAPAIVPSIGVSNKRFGSELVIFGSAGVMWTAGVFW